MLSSQLLLQTVCLPVIFGSNSFLIFLSVFSALHVGHFLHTTLIHNSPTSSVPVIQTVSTCSKERAIESISVTIKLNLECHLDCCLAEKTPVQFTDSIHFISCVFRYYNALRIDWETDLYLFIQVVA